ncbi:MAG TPA: prepilin-type N-terminal cleavage/methylation domain-containing protein, partial [Planctomycetota bacterium]|nr:prepilin-type N-terminal cleavage/methylation domain-containing protein [Planctomycetota bacterium]
PGFTLIELLVVIAIIAILAAIIIPAVFYVQFLARETKDLEHIRGMGNAFSLYQQKYSHFPAMVNMADGSKVKSIADARVSGKECLALKLLMKADFVTDARIFFSPRDAGPDETTLALMQADLDPAKDPAFATTYGYDPGHNTNHGATPFFGSTKSCLDRNPGIPAHLLTCDQTAKVIDPPASGTWTYPNRLPTGSTTQPDDIYKDDSGTFGWHDACLYETVGTLGP